MLSKQRHPRCIYDVIITKWLYSAHLRTSAISTAIDLHNNRGNAVKAYMDLHGKLCRLTQRIRRQHKRELVIAGLESGEMREGEVGWLFKHASTSTNIWLEVELKWKELMASYH